MIKSTKSLNYSLQDFCKEIAEGKKKLSEAKKILPFLQDVEKKAIVKSVIKKQTNANYLTTLF